MQKEQLTLNSGMRSTRNNWLLLFCALIGLAIVFFVPYHVPMPPSPSVSYHFGYNNRVGIVILVFFLALGSFLTRGMGIPFSAPGESAPAPRGLLVGALLAVLLGCAGMYLFAGRFGGFGESFYNIDRVWFLLQGKRPYVDFEWVYGVYFLYVPLFLCKAFGLGVISATYLAWTLSFLCGIGLLFAVVNMINYPSTKRSAIFLLLLGAMYPYIASMGPDPILRHVAPVFFVLLVHRLFSRGGMTSRVYAAMFAAAGVAVLLLLISPETAIALTFACICSFLLDARRNPASSIGLSVALLAAFAVFFWTANQFHVLDTMLGFAGGVASFPIIPAPHIILYFSALFLCACYVYWRFAKVANHDNTFCVIAYSLPVIAAALGRCDAPHVFLNGLGIFLVSLFYVSNYPVAWRWSRLAFLVFIIVLPTVAGLWLYTPNFASVFLNTLEEGKNQKVVNGLLNLVHERVLQHFSAEKRQKFEARLDQARALAENPKRKSLSEIYPDWPGGFSAPFGYRPNHLGSDLTTRVDYGFYQGLENVYTPVAIRRKIDELASQPQRALLLQDDFDNGCLVNPSAEKRIIRFLFFYPYSAKARNSESIYGPLCEYIHAEYRKQQEPPTRDGYGLWVRKASDVPQGDPVQAGASRVDE